ncbi:MAG TPA: carbohydrate binding domain-containing protein, partial [Desulfobacterales bacterium]|nr:carbohydrate binding domain-containing protein [Desulfobacterales bacterium]
MLASVTPAGAAELVQNGGFEQEELGSVAMWSTSAWVPTDDAVRFFVTSDAKHGGSRSFAIANLQPNDSRLMQWIAVKPGTSYRISCWIYAQGIETPSIGANISVLGATVAAGDVRDTAGKWQLVELYGKTGPRQRAIAVLARLGFYGSLATGLALFDDFSVEELPGPPAGKTVSSLESTDVVVVQPLPPSAEPTTVTGRGRASAAAIPTAVVIALGVLALAAIVVAVFALASTLVARRYEPVATAVSGRIPIASLITGVASRPLAAGRARGGRRRGAAHEIEHRSWTRDALESPITVRRRRKDGGFDTFRMRTVDV